MRPTQSERTALAEHRTGAATLAVAIVLLRASVLDRSPLPATIAAAAVVLSLLELLASRRAYAARAQGPPQAAMASAAALILTATAGVMVSLD